MKKNEFWLQKIIWIYDFQKPVLGIAVPIATLSIFGNLWTIFESSGFLGSPQLSITLFFISGFCVLILIFLSKPLRWYILFKAIKDYIQTNNLLNELTSDKILVGIGPGGAISVGMVAKAIREIGQIPPKVIVLDMRYEKKEDSPLIGSLFPDNFTLNSESCWIIQGNISSGKSLTELKSKYSLQNSKVFAFVISSHVDDRENVNEFMAEGTRNILPWEMEKG